MLHHHTWPPMTSQRSTPHLQPPPLSSTRKSPNPTRELLRILGESVSTHHTTKTAIKRIEISPLLLELWAEHHRTHWLPPLFSLNQTSPTHPNSTKTSTKHPWPLHPLRRPPQNSHPTVEPSTTTPSKAAAPQYSTSTTLLSHSSTPASLAPPDTATKHQH